MTVKITGGRYLGGHTACTRKLMGALRFDDTGLAILTAFGKPQFTVHAAGIDTIQAIPADQTRHPGAVVAFGALGALLTHGKPSGTVLLVRMRDGQQALFRAEKTDPIRLRAQVQPWMLQHGIGWFDDTPARP